MKIGEICTREVATIDANQSLREAARMMRDQHVGDLVIVDQHRKPTGIITDRDIVVGVLGVGLDATALAAGDITALRVAVVDEGEDVFDAVGRMRELGVRRLPVVDQSGRLVGMFTLDDFLEVMAREMREITLIIRREQRREVKTRMALAS